MTDESRALIAKWRNEADSDVALAHAITNGFDGGMVRMRAAAKRKCADELEAALARADAEPLTTTVAAIPGPAHPLRPHAEGTVGLRVREEPLQSGQWWGVIGPRGMPCLFGKSPEDVEGQADSDERIALFRVEEVPSPAAPNFARDEIAAVSGVLACCERRLRAVTETAMNGDDDGVQG